MRPSNRKFNQIRPITIKTNVNKNAEGSCLIKCGETHIICTATVEDSVPPFMRKSGLGWVTAEYAMLPRSTNSRMKREASRGKQGGRTLEIQRLIGRSLRACVDRVLLGERQIIIDCDVIQADGGTRCAAITGGWVALKQAADLLLKNGSIKENPIVHQIAAVSCGILREQAILDLDYEEDSNISTDSNFVMNELGAVIEVQASAEKNLFSRKELSLYST